MVYGNASRTGSFRNGSNKSELLLHAAETFEYASTLTGSSAMTMRPDPTFHASPKLAMEAPPENFAYTLLLSPDFSKPDALAVIDVKRLPNL
jgi:hypothetical protein